VGAHVPKGRILNRCGHRGSGKSAGTVVDLWHNRTPCRLTEYAALMLVVRAPLPRSRTCPIGVAPAQPSLMPACLSAARDPPRGGGRHFDPSEMA